MRIPAISNVTVFSFYDNIVVKKIPMSLFCESKTRYSCSALNENSCPYYHLLLLLRKRFASPDPGYALRKSQALQNIAFIDSFSQHVLFPTTIIVTDKHLNTINKLEGDLVIYAILGCTGVPNCRLC